MRVRKFRCQLLVGLQMCLSIRYSMICLGSKSRAKDVAGVCDFLGSDERKAVMLILVVVLEALRYLTAWFLKVGHAPVVF